MKRIMFVVLVCVCFISCEMEKDYSFSSNVRIKNDTDYSISAKIDSVEVSEITSGSTSEYKEVVFGRYYSNTYKKVYFYTSKLGEPLLVRGEYSLCDGNKYTIKVFYDTLSGECAYIISTDK